MNSNATNRQAGYAAELIRHHLPKHVSLLPDSALKHVSWSGDTPSVNWRGLINLSTYAMQDLLTDLGGGSR